MLFGGGGRKDWECWWATVYYKGVVCVLTRLLEIPLQAQPHFQKVPQVTLVRFRTKSEPYTYSYRHSSISNILLSQMYNFLISFLELPPKFLAGGESGENSVDRTPSTQKNHPTRAEMPFPMEFPKTIK